MSYKETPEEIASEEHDDDLDETEIRISSDEELKFEDEGEESNITLEETLDDVSEEITAKSKPKTVFSLKARRAIEDHLEKRRLRKELDYLYDDDFSADDKNNPPKES